MSKTNSDTSSGGDDNPKMDIGQTMEICNGIYSGSTGVVSKISEKMVTIQLDTPVMVYNKDGRRVTRKIVTVRKSSAATKILQPPPSPTPPPPSSPKDVTESSSSTDQSDKVQKLQNEIKRLKRQISDKNKYWKERLDQKNDQIQDLVAKVEQRNKCIEKQSQNTKKLEEQLRLEKSRLSAKKNMKKPPLPPQQQHSPHASSVAKVTTPPMEEKKLPGRDTITTPYSNNKRKLSESSSSVEARSNKKLKRSTFQTPVFKTRCQHTAKTLKNKILPTKPTHDWEEVATLLVEGNWKFESGKNHLKFSREYYYDETSESNKEVKKQVITMSCTPGSNRTGKNIISDLKSRDEEIYGSIPRVK